MGDSCCHRAGWNVEHHCVGCGRLLCLTHAKFEDPSAGNNRLLCVYGCVPMARIHQVLLAARVLLVPGWHEGLTFGDDGSVRLFDPEIGISLEEAVCRAAASQDESDWTLEFLRDDAAIGAQGLAAWLTVQTHESVMSLFSRSAQRAHVRQHAA